MSNPVTDDVQCSPSAAFTANRVTLLIGYISQLLAVSKGCSNISGAASFHEVELSVSQTPTSRSVLCCEALAKVADLGKARTSAHHGARIVSCGVDRWCCNHFPGNQKSSSSRGSTTPSPALRRGRGKQLSTSTSADARDCLRTNMGARRQRAGGAA